MNNNNLKERVEIVKYRSNQLDTNDVLCKPIIQTSDKCHLYRSNDFYIHAHEMVKLIDEQQNYIKELEMRIHHAKEVYISMDGFKPETAPEGYCLWLLKSMYEELCGEVLDYANAI